MSRSIRRSRGGPRRRWWTIPASHSAKLRSRIRKISRASSPRSKTWRTKDVPSPSWVVIMYTTGALSQSPWTWSCLISPLGSSTKSFVKGTIRGQVEHLMFLQNFVPRWDWWKLSQNHLPYTCLMSFAFLSWGGLASMPQELFSTISWYEFWALDQPCNLMLWSIWSWETH